MNSMQGTVGGIIHMNGVGLHSGKNVSLEIHPAPVGHGICFQRMDIPKQKAIIAHPLSVRSTSLCTTIGEGTFSVSTIEHLMAAFCGLHIHNALVKVNGPELPILDGSAFCFVEDILKIGVKKYQSLRPVLALSQRLTVQHDDQFLTYEPLSTQDDPVLKIDYTIDFPDSSAIGKQTLSLDWNDESFWSFYKARTFCRAKDIQTMRAHGQALGGSLENAVVVDGDKVLNPEGFRYPDECVRHKVLDFIGDLSLLPYDLIGTITAYKAGHHLNNQFTRTLYQEFCSKKKTPIKDRCFQKAMVDSR